MNKLTKSELIERIKGGKFNFLSIQEILPRSVNEKQKVKCLCDCGKVVVRSLYDVRTGQTKSCGCYKSQQTKLRNTLLKKKHTKETSASRDTWRCMKARCENPKNISYSRYGAVGISVCERWQNFDNFLLDMGSRPSLHDTLDRLDSTKGYSKENCRWASRLQQTRSRKNSISHVFGNCEMLLSEWSIFLGLSYTQVAGEKRRNKLDKRILKVIESPLFAACLDTQKACKKTLDRIEHKGE